MVSRHGPTCPCWAGRAAKAEKIKYVYRDWWSDYEENQKPICPPIL